MLPMASVWAKRFGITRAKYLPSRLGYIASNVSPPWSHLSRTHLPARISDWM
jgi:hypothetical protein